MNDTLYSVINDTLYSVTNDTLYSVLKTFASKDKTLVRLKVHFDQKQDYKHLQAKICMLRKKQLVRSKCVCK